MKKLFKRLMKRLYVKAMLWYRNSFYKNVKSSEDNEKICTGCFRSLNEISLWSQVDNNMRHQFLSNIKNRKNFYKVTE